MYERLLKKFIPIPDIEKYENYMFIGPHPDDIEIGCGATAAKLRAQGKKVTFVIVTDGSAGTTDTDITRDQLAWIRKEEALKSASIIGAEVVFLDYTDGGDYKTEDVARSLTKEMARFGVDVVFAPDPKVRSEHHPDHIKAGNAAMSAVLLGGFPIYAKEADSNPHSVKAVALYYTDRPNVFVDIGKFTDIRDKCLECFPSQFNAQQLAPVKKYISIRQRMLGNIFKKQDGYRAMSTVHMHCMPEASKW